jgi:NAD(P)-dependent dehydrogenase (short-subunit alcohol dehydrogenase family)
MDGSVTLITGAASGIGAALARGLATPGRGLVLHTRANATKLEAVAEAARTAGAETEIVLGDLLDPATPALVIEAARARFGRLDHLVSNAGFADKRRFGQLDEAGLEKSWHGIGRAFFQLATAALPLLEASPSGRVVTVSSFLAHVFRLGADHFPASAAAKAALEAMTRSLAAQLGPKGVTVNCVVPGYVRKDPGAHAALDEAGWKRALDRVPLGRLGLPDEIAGTIAFLLTPEAAYITGQSIHVDGGLTL